MLAINILTSVLIISLFVILRFRKDNSIINVVLAWALLVPSLNFMDNVLILTDVIYAFPWTYFLVQITATLFGPLSYYYILLMTERDNPSSFMWMKVITAGLMGYGLVLAIRFGLMDQAAQTVYMDRVQNGPYPDDMNVYSLFVFSHQLLYFTMNALQVNRFKKEVKKIASNLETAKVTYLTNFVIILWILTLITVLLYGFADTIYGDIGTIYVEYIYLPLVLVTIFIYIIYYAFNEHAIFSKQEYLEHLSKSVPNIELQNSKLVNNVNAEIDSELNKQIHAIIDSEELYKNPEINISELAERLNLPTYRLTNCLKQHDTTFYELIREKRVNKAKELISDPTYPFTIEAVAYEVGFKSRASFYRAFKKYENSDPSTFLVKSSG